MATFPPRPDAVFTMMISDDQQKSVQTLLYSTKKTAPPFIMNGKAKGKYPPELVVVCSKEVSTTAREELCPTFCTRILEDDGDLSTFCKRYNSILYLRPECLVLLDVVSPAFFDDNPVGSRSGEGSGILLTPHLIDGDIQTVLQAGKFDSAPGVQQFGADSVTSAEYDEKPVSGCAIVDFSDTEPWDGKSESAKLWKPWYEKSRAFGEKETGEREAREERERRKRDEIARKLQRRQREKAESRPPPPRRQNPGVDTHKAVTKRYRALRKEGLSAQEAMEKARAELEPKNQASATQQVAAMFGMGGM